ncbi:MAG: hypothetical protein AAGF44_02090 [Pseudomonadota bacterium]
MSRWIRTTALGAGCAAFLALGGCAQTQGIASDIDAALPTFLQEPSTPEVAAVLDHDVEYSSVGLIVQGAVVGAAIGCGIGALIAGGRGCAVGAGVGLAAGAGTGAVVAEGNREQIEAESEADRIFAELKREQANLSEYKSKVSVAVRRLRADHRELRRLQAAKEISAEEAEARSAAIKRDLVLLKENTQDNVEAVEERNAKLEEQETELEPRSKRIVNASFNTIYDADDTVGELENDIGV